MASRGLSQTLARKRILKARGKQCEECGYKGYVELHHTIPVSEGGDHSRDNVVLLCDTCHRQAHNYKPREPGVARWATE